MKLMLKNGFVKFIFCNIPLSDVYNIHQTNFKLKISIQMFSNKIIFILLLISYNFFFINMNII